MVEVLKARHTELGLSELCAIFGKSRQAWYARRTHASTEAMQALVVLDLVQTIRQDMPRLGVRKLYYLMQEDFAKHGIRMGRDKLFSLLAQRGLLVRPRRRYTRTTNSYHRFRKYPNLIKEVVITRVAQVWVADITYIQSLEGFVYLSLITDAYSHKVVGYALRPSLAAELCLASLHMALAQWPKEAEGLIHHSDRGVQYCSNAYEILLQSHQIDISMAEKGLHMKTP